MTFTTYLESLDTRSITHFVKSILTSSPHSVTDTTFPDISIRLSVLLDTSRLDLVVRRDMSSTLLHTPITSVKGYTQQRAFVFLFRILVIHSLQQSYKYLAQNTKTTTHKQINTVSDLFFSHTQLHPHTGHSMSHSLRHKLAVGDSFMTSEASTPGTCIHNIGEKSVKGFN